MFVQMEEKNNKKDYDQYKSDLDQILKNENNYP